MNILLVSGPGISLKEPYNSGIEAFIVSLANQLVLEGHHVTVIAKEVGTNAKFRFIDPFTSIILTQPELPDLSFEGQQFQELDVSLYDVIHYNMFYPQLLEAGSYFNKPSILTLHSPADEKRINIYEKLSRYSDLIFVAISARIKRQWDSALAVNMPLIQNGINMDLWPLRNSEDRNYLLWSARINAEKNVVDAILLAKHMHLPLKIAGRVTDERYFDEMVKPHLDDQIQYVGHVDQKELNRLAENAFAYLATALWQEPFGLAALEMLASGVPVVGFDTAVPTDWNHDSVLKTTSRRWQDLVPLVEQSKVIDPKTCKQFATDMNIQKMALEYLILYKGALLKKDTGNDEKIVNCSEDLVSLRVANLD